MRVPERLKVRWAPWSQLGLRGLFFATTACAVSLGVYVEGAREQAAVVRSLRAKGAKVMYHGDTETLSIAVPRALDLGESARVWSEIRRADDAEAWRRWLRDPLGADFVDGVIAIELDAISEDGLLLDVAKLRQLEDLGTSENASRISDEGVAHLAGLTAIKSIGLPYSQISDKSMPVFARFRRLTELYLPGARITDAGLQWLQTSTELKSLCIGGNFQGGGQLQGVTDVGLRTLAGRVKLETLDLSSSSITSKGLMHLARLTNLRELNLANAPRIGDTGMRHIASLANLEELVLSHTSVTSEGLSHLAHLKKLRVLDLSGDHGVTDEGVAHLSRLVGLEELKLHDTEITSRAVKHLYRLRNLRSLDLSENRRINEDALEPLASLPKLEHLDLHNTRVGACGPATRNNQDALRALRQVHLLDVSGTGIDVRWLEGFFAPGVLVGSRTRWITRPRMEGLADFFSVTSEIDQIADDAARGRSAVARMLRGAAERGDGDAAEPAAWFPRSSMFDGSLRRMVCISSEAAVGQAFRRQRPAVEAILSRLRRTPYADKTARAGIFREFLFAAGSNEWLARLYAAASDFQFADGLEAHLDSLREVNERWSLTDVEREEYQKTPDYLRTCMRDACRQLGINNPASSTAEWPQEIDVIWRRECAPRSKGPYVSCWEGWKVSRR